MTNLAIGPVFTLYWLVMGACTVTLCVAVVSTLDRCSASIRHTFVLSAFATLCVVPIAATALASRADSRFAFPESRQIEPNEQKHLATTTKNSNHESVSTSKQLDAADWFHPETLSWAFAAVWMIGLVSRLLAASMRILRGPRLEQIIAPLSESNVKSLFQRAKQALGIRQKVRLCDSHCHCPFTFGVIHPRVVLPTEYITSKSKRQIEAALIHELMHVKRRDILIELFASFICHAYWWCPCIWVLRAELALAAEEICDAKAKELQGDGTSLAELIVASVESAVAIQIPWDKSLSRGPGRFLRKRVAALLQRSQSRPHSKFFAAIAVACPLALVMISASWTHENANIRFGKPYNLGARINSSGPENAPYTSADGCKLYFQSPRNGSLGGPDLWVTTRSSPEHEWSIPTNKDELHGINTPDNELLPRISKDGLQLTFSGRSKSAAGRSSMFQAVRQSRQSPWTSPTALSSVLNTGSGEEAPCLRFDGLEIAFHRHVPGKRSNLFSATRSSVDSEWGDAKDLGIPINSESYDFAPVYSPDGLNIVFDSLRAGSRDLWVISRSTLNSPWSKPKHIRALNTQYTESPGNFSEDGTFFFLSDRPGGHGSHDIWASELIKVPQLGILISVGLMWPVGWFLHFRKYR